MTTITDFKIQTKKFAGLGEHTYNNRTVITLDNGKKLINDFGRYATGLVLLSKNETVSFRELKEQDMINLFNREFDGFPTDIYIGNYFVSKKGNKCFDIREDGKFLMLKIPVGTHFNTSHWGPENDESFIYWHKAMSNGGGRGTITVIVPKDWKAKMLSEEDI